MVPPRGIARYSAYFAGWLPARETTSYAVRSDFFSTSQLSLSSMRFRPRSPSSRLRRRVGFRGGDGGAGAGGVRGGQSPCREKTTWRGGRKQSRSAARPPAAG